MTRFVFPSIMATLSLGQCCYYAHDGDWRKAGYWACCVAITFFVTI